MIKYSYLHNKRMTILERLLITAKEAAKRAGISTVQACRCARMSAAQGNEWPIRRQVGSNTPWEAPVSEWDKILNPKSKRIRKKRNRISRNFSEMSPLPKWQLYSASQASKVLGIYSAAWFAHLARKCRSLGWEWPQKSPTGAWLAPLEKWVKIALDTEKSKNKERVEKN